jgi:predicted transcriptional regulator
MNAASIYTSMKNTICDAAEVWKQFEDLLVPCLGLSVVDRAAYSHLLRHSRLEGRVRLRFGILWLARGIGLSDQTARDAVRRLVSHGALRLVERDKRGHLVEVRLPGEIRGIRARGKGEGLPAAAGKPGGVNSDRGGDKALSNIDPYIETIDFMQTKALRGAIHARERGQCFYCLRRLTSALQGLDHVVPRAQSAIPTATSSPAAWNAIPRKARNPPETSCAGCTARGA